MTQADLTHICSTIDAAKDRRGAACVNSWPKRPEDLTQQSPPPPISAGPKPRFEAGIDAGFDAEDDGKQGPDTDGLAIPALGTIKTDPEVLARLSQSSFGSGRDPSSLVAELQARITRKEAANEALVAKLGATLADMSSLQRQAENWRAECVRLSAVLVAVEEERARAVTDSEKAAEQMRQDILGGKIDRAGRQVVRDACDKMDAPKTGRDASNDALGRISGRGGVMSGWGR